MRVLEIVSANDEPVYRKVNFCNDMLAQLLYIGVRIGIGERLSQMFAKYQHFPPQAAVKLGLVILNDSPYFSQTFLQHIFSVFVSTASNIQIQYISPVTEEQQDIIKYHLAIELNRTITKFQDCVDQISPESLFQYLVFCAEYKLQHSKVMQKAVTNYKNYAPCTELLQFAFEHEEFQLVANVVDDCLRQNDIAAI